MATTNLGLPTISGNMTADVVRDLNALANGMDGKAGAASGLAMLGADGKLTPAQAPTISDATTTQKGAVQLEDSTASVSTTKAATPNSVKTVNDALIAHNLDAVKHRTQAEKDKLAGIEANANNYIHPGTHSPSIITQDTSNRFVTDSEKTTWSAKETPTGAQDKANAAKDAAISASATDATSKANTAEANAKNASIPLAQKGAPNGVATTDGTGKLDVSMVPTSMSTGDGIINGTTTSATYMMIILGGF